MIMIIIVINIEIEFEFCIKCIKVIVLNEELSVFNFNYYCLSKPDNNAMNCLFNSNNK